MYGLKPEDIRFLEHLRGEGIIQIAVGEFQVQFQTGSGVISVEGRCELFDAENRLVDFWDRGARSNDFRFFELLGKTIDGISVDTDGSFVATFEGGAKLRVIDNSDKYESFSVGNLFV